MSSELSVDTAAVLGQARFFSALDKAQLARVAALGQARSFPQDTRIYTVGDAVDDFYVLADGMVRFTLGLG
ncbi:MAG TPA: transcriptional regulator, partial [Burkholderiales bacterium]|nr:transcriptional regulator [Burkholderiales bacterium]